MTREEHLQFCKDRALTYVEMGDVAQAWASFISDMSNHPETSGHSALALGSQLFFNGHLNTPDKMRRFIKGFN